MTKKKYTPGPTIKGDFDRVGLVNALTEAKVKLAKINATAKSGIALISNASTGFNKPYKNLDLGLINGRLIRIEELSK